MLLSEALLYFCSFSFLLKMRKISSDNGILKMLLSAVNDIGNLETLLGIAIEL